MSSVNITLPDGSIQSVPAGSRPIDVAQSIGTRLAETGRILGDAYLRQRRARVRHEGNAAAVNPIAVVTSIVLSY